MHNAPRDLEGCNPTSCPVVSSYLSELKAVLDSVHKLNESEIQTSTTSLVTVPESSSTSMSTSVESSSSQSSSMTEPPSMTESSSSLDDCPTNVAPGPGPPPEESTSSITQPSSSAESTTLHDPSPTSGVPGPPPEDSTTSTSWSTKTPKPTTSSSSPSSPSTKPETATSSSQIQSPKPSRSTQASSSVRSPQTSDSVIRNDAGSSRTTSRSTAQSATSLRVDHTSSFTGVATSTPISPQNMQFNGTSTAGNSSQPVMNLVTSSSEAPNESGNLMSAVTTAPDFSSQTLDETYSSESSSQSTGFLQEDAPSSNSFLNNSSAMAGVFSAVGILAVLFLVGIVLFCRRRSRVGRRRSRWLMVHKETTTDYHDHANSEAPMMQTVSSQRHSTSPTFSSRRGSILNERAEPMDPEGSPFGNVPFHAGLPPPLQPVPVRVAVPPPPPESGRSSPSLYPPSTHESEDESHEDPPPCSLPPLDLVANSAIPPPRPARSVLRNTLSRPVAYSGDLSSPTQSQWSPTSATNPRNPFLAEGEEPGYHSPPSSLEGLYSRPTLLSVKRHGSASPT